MDKRAVVRVGSGRGFVVQGERERYVITAGHCLPHLPPCLTFSETQERTYENLIGTLNEESTVWTECVFVDPISDLAVLGSPNGQDLSEEARRYQELVERAAPLRISDAPESGPAWLLSLEGNWFRCTASHRGRALWLTSDAIIGGMSGSPVVAESGAAIGVVATGPNAPHPLLAYSLPAGLLRQFD